MVEQIPREREELHVKTFERALIGILFMEVSARNRKTQISISL
jgi:hypothetical protein